MYQLQGREAACAGRVLVNEDGEEDEAEEVGICAVDALIGEEGDEIPEVTCLLSAVVVVDAVVLFC
jgi:hypothetical protein